MVQEHDEQIQAVIELSEEQLDQVAGGDSKNPWPPPSPPPSPGSALSVMR